MNEILEILSRGVEQLHGRESGPLHLRLVITPAVVAILAIRAGLKDAREGQPSFLWAVFTHPTERRQRIRSAWQDIARIFAMALVIDAGYQIFVLRGFSVLQALIVGVTLAVVPYILFRGTTTILSRSLHGNVESRTGTNGRETKK
jgi:hypothetical protein